MSQSELVSFEPATGNEVWRGHAGNVEEAVERAVDAKRGWAQQPLGQRIELVRRFANQVRKQAEP